jgi:general secretion pathway protein G
MIPMTGWITTPPATPSAGRRPRQRGFTLVEAMFVVGLVAILVGIAIPSYRSYRDRVRTSTAIREVAEMAAMAQRFELEQRAFPNSLADIGLNGRLDPWGRAYVYYNVEANGRGGARKDRRLNPLNTDFDLYSLGPDGKTKPQVTQKDSIDDIIRASNGLFVGVAADF